MLYGLCLELTGGGRGYLCKGRSGKESEWDATPSDPLIFEREDIAQRRAFDMIAKDADYFGRISVVRLIPGVSQWFVR